MWLLFALKAFLSFYCWFSGFFYVDGGLVGGARVKPVTFNIAMDLFYHWHKTQESNNITLFFVYIVAKKKANSIFQFYKC